MPKLVTPVTVFDTVLLNVIKPLKLVCTELEVCWDELEYNGLILDNNLASPIVII
jgi:hypothetical protein